MTLTDRLVELHRALAERRLPHAFGGAIALAYWTQNPRGTSDIDVNVFIRAAESERVLAALPGGIAQPPDTVYRIERDGQIRLWWGETPVDLFFNNVPVHEDAERHRRDVPLEGMRIPVLGPVELAVFKAMFDRTQDWADIEAMIAAQTLDVDEVRATIRGMLDPEDHRFGRLEEAERRAEALTTES